jgi:acyl-coenzyme A thioesterase PaaI-like protein
MEQHASRTFHAGFASCKSTEDVAVFADRGTMTGLSNPNSPPIELSMEGEVAVGLVTFGPPFEGIPGHVHGGIVAAAFDQVFGYLQTKRGIGSLTAVLTVRYRLPTPLRTPLRIEARVVAVDGRRSTVSARMLAAETVTAEAEGVFVAVDKARLHQIFAGKHD